MRESARHIEAVLKTLEVLECFKIRPALSLREICEITEINKSRIIRICGTLASKAYLSYESESRSYRLGSNILSLGKVYEHSNNLISLARPLLRQLADATGESASLFVVDGLERLCLAREDGTSSLRFNIIEGQRLSLYAGAGGKVLLAFGPEELIRKARQLRKPNTNAVVGTSRGLEGELEEVRRQGYAFSSGERDPELAALSVPIYRYDGVVCAAMSIAGPIGRFSPEHNVKHLEMLLISSHRLSQMLGYSGKEPPVTRWGRHQKSHDVPPSLEEV